MVMMVLVLILQAHLAVVSLPMVGTGKIIASIEDALVAVAGAPGGCGCKAHVDERQILKHY